jgi:ubiquinone/menaquinone biosynthesis C-methylase UbiE
VDAIDFSAEMIATARRQAAEGIAFEVGDAENLAYDAETFDAVAMNFGALHLSQPERAFVEARRVLRKGGAFGFTVWRPPEEAQGFALILHAIQTSGDPHVQLPAGPPFYRFADPEECRRTLVDAGFEKIETRTLPLTWTVPSPEALYEAFYAGTARTGGLLRAQTGAAADAIRQTVLRDSAQFRGADGALRIPMPAFPVIAS